MLFRKMLRDIWGSKGSYMACLVLVILGLVTFTSFSIGADNLRQAQEDFYRETQFAEGFAEVMSMPEARIGELAREEGVKKVGGRISREVRVYDPQADIGVYLKLVAIDTEDTERINDLLLLEGRPLKAGEKNLWLDDMFFEANQLSLGDTIEIIAAGQIHEFRLEGVAMSPEFTYPLRTLGELYPNPEQFGIGFLSRETMWQLFPDLRGQVNDVAFILEPQAAYDEVESRLETTLKPYGLISIYPRDNQTSHLILQEEIDQLSRMASVIPLMLLMIAALIIYFMLKRLVEQQRGQIGILKAFGYSNFEVMVHYLGYALLIGLLGGLVGGLTGMYLANPLTWLLYEFFHVPEVYLGFSWYYLGMGLVISLAIFLVAGYQGCKYALTLTPAEAMRPPAPASGRKTLLEKAAFFSEMLTIQGKMAIRNLGRQKGRTAFLFLGVMLSCAVVVVTYSLNDIFDKLVFYQVEKVETYHAKVLLTGPRHQQPIKRELWALDETTWVEPLAEVPIKLTHAWREEQVVLLGIPQDSVLYSIRDQKEQRIAPSDQGLILSEQLAENLDVKEGDTVRLESPYLLGEDDYEEIAVYRIVPQYLGMNAYLELEAVQELLGQGPLATSYMVDVKDHPPASGEDKDAQRTREEEIQQNIASLRARYQESEMVAGVDGTDEKIQEIRDLLESFGVVMYLYVLVGVIMAFAIIYSSSFIILSERNRELASMKVLGMSSREVFSVITFEQWFIGILAILAGLPLAQGLMFLLADALDTDLYTIPTDLSLESLFMGGLITAISILIAQMFALKKVEQLDLVGVLKSRE